MPNFNLSIVFPNLKLMFTTSIIFGMMLLFAETGWAKNTQDITDIAGTVGSVAQCALNVAQTCTPAGQASLIVTVGSKVIDISGAIECIQERANGGSNLSVISTCVSSIPGLPFVDCIGLADQIAKKIGGSIAGAIDRCQFSAPPVPKCSGNCQACCIDKAKKRSTRGCGGKLSARFCEDNQAYAACFLKCNCPNGHNIDPGTVKYGGLVGNCFLPAKKLQH